jgi:pyruvate ferredoxin oxidoreductase beta subunit
MELQTVKFYQTGTFTVGNRLLAEDERSVQANMDRTNSLNSGHRACQGCGEALGARYAIDAAMRATKGQLIAVNATGCLEVFSTPYPETSWQIPWLHSLFGNAAAVASGVAAAMRVKGRDSVRVIAQGGDGGTTDIGFGCLSGMFERNDDVLYICYDNEAYMNTGVQRSSATPPAARTATTMAVGAQPGNPFGTGKNVPLIAMAHHIPYVATASVANLCHDGREVAAGGESLFADYHAIGVMRFWQRLRYVEGEREGEAVAGIAGESYTTDCRRLEHDG